MPTISTNRLRDQLGNGDVTRVATGTMSMIDALQRQEHMLPGERLGAIIAAFVLTLEASRMSAADAVGTTRNLMADAQGRRAEFAAVSDYLKEEVLPS